MTPASLNRATRRELDDLLRDGLLAPEQHAALAVRYPVTRWDWRALGRWFLILGAVTLAAGLCVLVRDYLEFTLEKLAIGLVVLVAALLGGARWLVQRRPTMVWTPRALELLGGFAIIGLTFTLGLIYSTGSGNWPALLLIDLLVLVPLAYLLRNVLLLVLSAVVFFSWFGGFTGYASGWGAYWFGMSYPLRFVGAGVAIALVGVAHLMAEQGPLLRYRGFAKVWLSAGIYFTEMALWILSIFGNFDLEAGWRTGGASELLLFNLLWAGMNAGLLLAGARTAMGMLTGYAVTFGVIQVYTLYFAHLAEEVPLFLSALLAGGSALWLAVTLERHRRGRADRADSAA
ncbi:MAG: DUF2157 domain-containing protein [Planctomycetes bacterium]|nr:DUF2157 domain-containing protein [Planctomycetota bacterium]